LINNVRGVQGYTGSFMGEKISEISSCMGMPSMGIYSYELFEFFDVDQILRVGSAGALRADIKVRDIVLGAGACTNSAYAEQFHLRGSFAPIADFSLLEKCVKEAREMGLCYHVGNLLSSDTFYDAGEGDTLAWGKMGVMAVEMEAAALYMNAARCGKKALAICTISDSLVTGEATTAEERQNSFTDMMELALRTAVKK
ncbi:MAG: purine-nucleoside phosphorylase, partial [Clostridia bacterium]|nr:purine-nucleoside phosphorylase [Clostridia bacterium]